MTRVACIALLLLSVACGGATAPPHDARDARNGPVVVVIAGDDRPDAEVRLRTPGATVVRAPEDAPTAAERAAPALERARTLYRDLSFERSLAAVGEAQVLLEQAPRTEADFEALHTALLYRAMNERALGHDDRALAALRQAAALRPEATLDPGRIPPDVRARYQEVRTALQAEAPVAVSVTSTPSSATVSVDARPVGRTPATVHASPARHFVGVEAPGHVARMLPVSFDAGSPLHVDLPEASRVEAAAQIAALPAGSIHTLPPPHRTALGRALGATRLLRATRANGRWEGALVDLDAGTAEPVEGTDLDALLHAAAPPEADRSVLSSPWLWIAAGVVVAAGAATAVLLLHDPGHQVVLTPSP